MSPSRLRRRMAALASIVAAVGLLAGTLPAAAWDGYRDDNLFVEIRNVGIGGPGRDEHVALPGSSVSVSFDWAANNVAAPENFLAIKYGWASSPKPMACALVGNTHGSLKEGTASASLTAPSTAGSTYLRWEIVEDSCSGATTNPWSSGAYAPNPEEAFLGRLFVRNKLVTASNVTISGVNINDGLTDTTATQGQTISVTLSAKIDGRSCPTCRYRILVGWSDAAAPAVCIYNGKPLGQVRTISRTFNLVVPSNPVGSVTVLDRFVAFKTAKSRSTTCNKSSWPGGSPIATPGTSFLGHVAVPS